LSRLQRVWISLGAPVGLSCSRAHPRPSTQTLGKGKTMGTALYFVGLIISLVGGIWILVNAFKTSIWWGLGSLFVPFVSLIFVIMNWQQNKKPFLISVAGAVVILISVFVMGAGGGLMQHPVVPSN
jgi:hypothetical protein